MTNSTTKSRRSPSFLSAAPLAPSRPLTTVLPLSPGMKRACKNGIISQSYNPNPSPSPSYSPNPSPIPSSRCCRCRCRCPCRLCLVLARLLLLLVLSRASMIGSRPRCDRRPSSATGRLGKKRRSRGGPRTRAVAVAGEGMVC